MKKIIAINGGPRKGNNGNTVQMLKSALKGAEDVGAETKLIHLFDLHFHDCYSCFACKRLGAPTFGRCSYKDELTLVLDEIREEADALLVGSPVYYSDLTGETRAFLNRLVFPYYDYSPDAISLFSKRIPTALFMTANGFGSQYFQRVGENSVFMLDHFIGPCQVVTSGDTWQFPDYSKYASSAFDPEHKKYVYENEFPKDLQKAYQIGKKLATIGE